MFADFYTVVPADFAGFRVIHVTSDRAPSVCVHPTIGIAPMPWADACDYAAALGTVSGASVRIAR